MSYSENDILADYLGQNLNHWVHFAFDNVLLKIVEEAAI